MHLLLGLLLSLDIAALRKQFEYDPAAPLDVQQKLMFERDGVTVYDVSYASPKGGRVTAYLTAPRAKGKYPGIVFGHWGPGNRTEFLPEAQIYSRAGAVCLMIDYPWTRPSPWYANADDVAEPDKAIQLQVQAVIDLRRAFDLLSKRDDVDAARLGYTGHSYGAQFGAILSAVDKRIKAAVLMGGIPDMESILIEGNPPGIDEWRKKTGDAKIKAALEKLRSTAAVEYVPHAAPVKLLFQFARHEANFGMPAMERYAKAASEPKTVEWYETGHDLNDPRALTNRMRWLSRELSIKAVETAIKAASGL